MVVYPSVLYGGTSLLGLLPSSQAGYVENELRRSLWQAGHGHAGVLLLLSPTATEPNALMYLAYVGAAILALGMIVLGIGLFRQARA